MTDVLCAAFLLAGALTPLRWTETRFGAYSLRFLSLSIYLAIGPRVAWLTLGAAAIATLAFIVHGRIFMRAKAEVRMRAGSVITAAIASAVAMAVANLAAGAIHVGYPVPVTPLSSMVVQVKFWGVVNVAGAIGIVVDEVLARTLIRPPESDPTLKQLEPTVSSYVLAAVSSAPLLFAAQAVFDPSSLLPWTIALSWTFLLSAAFARQLERRWRIAQLVDELATKERLAAVGEVGARVVHQTRHQLGLIGITVHRITKRVSSLSGDDASVVREELEKLGEVQRELSDMLTGVLRQTSRTGPAALTSYADVVGNVARRLDALAVSRGVRLEVGDLAAAGAASPAHPDNVSDAIFNVVENALVAAQAEVVVGAAVRGATLVISVADDGPGMPASVIQRAAVPFVTTKIDGTGMGLAIARAAVEGERGALRIARAASGGCLIEIAVPIAVVTT